MPKQAEVIFDVKKHFELAEEGFRKHYAAVMENIGGHTEDQKSKFKKTINDMIKKNDAEYKELQRAFLNKDKDIIDAWFLFKVAKSVVAVVASDDKERMESLAQIFIRYPTAQIETLFQDYQYSITINLFYGNSEIRGRMLELILGSDGMGQEIMLNFIRIVFNETEISKETIARSEEEEMLEEGIEE